MMKTVMNHSPMTRETDERSGMRVTGYGYSDREARRDGIKIQKPCRGSRMCDGGRRHMSEIDGMRLSTTFVSTGQHSDGSVEAVEVAFQDALAHGRRRSLRPFGCSNSKSCSPPDPLLARRRTGQRNRWGCSDGRGWRSRRTGW